jgi:hypothetical protein
MKNAPSIRLLQFLAALCLLSVIPAKAAQFGDFTYTATATDVTLTGYTGTGGAITIPSSIASLPVISISNSAFSSKSSITSVTIPNSVTSIGYYAFGGCSGLRSIFISSSVTSIGDSSFTNCESLTNVTVDTSNSIYSSIDGVLFDKIKSMLIYFPRNKAVSYSIPASVSSIGNNAFEGCRGLTSVMIPSSVTSIGNSAFSDCFDLTSLTIPSGVTSIGNSAFGGCYSLTSVTIPSGVTSIGDWVFSSCIGLTSVTIPSGVTSIGDYAFNSCSGLTGVAIGSGVTSIGKRAFSGCANAGFKSIVIPSSVNSIGDSAFNGCSYLASLFFMGNAPTAGTAVFSTGTIYYVLDATNYGISYAGRPAQLIVNPAITTQPVSITVNQGGTATFTFSATGALPAYQWQKDGVDIVGATLATLSLSNVQTSDAASYTVTVTNAAGSVTSNAATLTVIIPPAITVPPGSVTTNLGSSASFSVTATGGGPYSYQWKKAGVNIAGATATTLSFGTLLSSDAGSYTVVVTNAAGSVTSSAATLTVISPPTISTQPASTRVNQAASATFSVVATGGTPYTYQWKRNGTVISGATAATLSLSNVQTSDEASYTVTVTNAAGSVTSNAAVLTVTVLITITTQPVSVTTNLGTSASFSVTATGSSPTYQWKKAGVNIAGATATTLSFGTLLSSDAGSYTVVVTNAAGSVTSSAATLTVISPPTLSLQPMSVTANLGTSASFSVTATGGSPYSYQWKKDGSDIVGATAATLSFGTLLSTDAGSYTVVVTNAAGSVTSSAATLTVISPPTISTQPVSISSNQGTSATFNVTAIGGGTYTYQWKKAGVNIVGATAATLVLSNVQPADASTYSVTVTNAMDNVTSNTATLTVVVPPVIIDQPTNIIANPSDWAVFSVVATGTAPTYKWMRNGVIVVGATQADLNFSVIQPIHVGTYKVVVSNAAGSVTSATVSLTLNTVFTQSQYDAIADAAQAEITDSPNNYGLYSLSQVQALHVGTPLLMRDSATGKFKLTIGVEKSTNLVNFSPMAIPVGAAMINAQGKMEFEFTAPDNAAFYRLESR